MVLEPSYPHFSHLISPRKDSSSATYNAQHATEEIDMDNLDQGFFASGLDSFDMGVIQNRFGFVNRGWMEGLGR